MAATGVSVQLIESIWLGPETDVRALESALATGAELGARFVLVAGNDPERARLMITSATASWPDRGSPRDSK